MKKYNRKKYLEFLENIETLLEAKNLTSEQKIERIKMLILIARTLEILGG